MTTPHWTCPGCNKLYLWAECPTCHMRGTPYTRPVPISIEGVEYIVQRQEFSPVTVLRSDGGRMVAGERHLVLSAFLAQQHP
jgi:hypothetical protein